MELQKLVKTYCFFLFSVLLLMGAEVQAQLVASSDSVHIRKIKKQVSDIHSVTSLLIKQNGELRFEGFFNGMEEGESVNIKSASKSILSLLTGIAIDKGFIESVEKPIHPFFQDYFEANPDSIKESITIKDLLTMRAGLETTSFHNYGRWVLSDNWIKFVLDQSMEGRPGGDMIYSTGTSHLLSAILTKATDMSTKAFAQKYLYGPMNIRQGGWDRDPQGYYMGGNNMALAPKDMLKIGQMVLNNGTYQGRRIVSEDWLQDSFQTYTRSNFNPYDYGYMWWKKPVGDYRVRFAWGFGGQYIFLIPALDAVVVMSGALQDATQSRSYKEPVFSLLREEIIPFLNRHKEL